MREILFRGQCKKSGEWLFGDFLSAWLDGIPWIIPTGEMEEVKVIPETVGQFTGMFDGTKWEDLTDAEKLNFYRQNNIGEDGKSVRFQYIDDVKHLWKGKKIFEGDIVRDNDGTNYPVVWGGTGFYLKYNPLHAHGFHYDLLPLCNYWHAHGAIIKVIGNIHDNPELLKAE